MSRQLDDHRKHAAALARQAEQGEADGGAQLASDSHAAAAEETRQADHLSAAQDAPGCVGPGPRGQAPSRPRGVPRARSAGDHAGTQTPRAQQPHRLVAAGPQGDEARQILERPQRDGYLPGLKVQKAEQRTETPEPAQRQSELAAETEPETDITERIDASVPQTQKPWGSGHDRGHPRDMELARGLSLCGRGRLLAG